MGKYSKLYKINLEKKLHLQVQDWLYFLKVSYK